MIWMRKKIIVIECNHIWEEKYRYKKWTTGGVWFTNPPPDIPIVIVYECSLCFDEFHVTGGTDFIGPLLGNIELRKYE